ncbi:23102_t:CDS:2 [Rhizophagus irregularis]|nr:23102_t:CDS:2 [Rhizophagus irregularis]
MRGDLDNEYSGKVIHIIPNADFTDKTFELVLVEANFAGSSSRTFAENFFEILAHDVLRKDNKSRTQPSIDAIAPENNGIHHLYQITIARKHNTKVNGLLKLKNHLEGNLPIHLYFVVPNINCIFDNFSFQNYVITENEKYKGWNATTK